MSFAARLFKRMDLPLLAAALCMAACFIAAPEAGAGEKRGGGDDLARLHKILDGLERGMAALDELDRRDELERLRRIADEVREKIRFLDREGRPENRGNDREREMVLREIEIMKLAMPALREAGRKDTAELLEHAIHARELALEGRRDEEARAIRESAPDLGAQVEILLYAGDLWEKFGHESKAEKVRELAGELQGRLERRRKAKERGGEARREEARDLVERRVKILKTAMAALPEAGREDRAHRLKREIQARLADAKGLEGAEADRVREEAPRPEEEIELLGAAARLLREKGDREAARAVAGLAEELGARPGQEAGRARGAGEERIRDLEERIGELNGVIEELKQALRDLKGKGR